MELALLPPIILAIAEQRSLDAVLSSIVTAVASQPDVALARVWLRDTDRSCPVCARHSRGYLRHLSATGEPTASRLVSMHNVAWTFDLLARARQAIAAGRLAALRADVLAMWA